MKHLRTFEEYLFEFVDITNPEAAETAAENKEKIQILWNNGHIIVSPDQMDYMKAGMSPMGFVLDFKKKSIQAPFMDDWSDSKQIKTFQSFLKDLIKVKIIDKKWKFKIMGNAVKMNFGGITVDKVLAYNSDFDKVIPRAFHGTSDRYLKEIKSKGLVPRKHSDASKNWDIGYTSDSDSYIYLTMDISRAEYYARVAVEKLEKDWGVKSKPIVIEIHDLSTDAVTVDDDFASNMGQVNLIHYLKTGKQIDPNNYISGIRSSSQFAHNGRIPSKMISKYHKVKKD